LFNSIPAQLAEETEVEEEAGSDATNSQEDDSTFSESEEDAIEP
jgi:hypothetical protein